MVFVLDYSASMEQGKRKKYALNAFLDIFEDYLEQTDRVAFIRFNQNVNIVFELNEKGINYKYLKQHIEATYDIVATGETAFYQAIYEGCKLFSKVHPIQSHQKWIVALTDGEDNASKINPDKITLQLEQLNINLIIVGIGLQKDCIQTLQSLIKNNRGAFIESVESKDLSIAFQAISNLINGNQAQLNIVEESFN